MTTHHAVLWIDHNEARLLALAPDGSEFQELAHLHAEHTHTRSYKPDGHRIPADAHFLADVERALGECEQVVIYGPGQARHELAALLEKSHSPVRERIVETHPADRVSDRELAAKAREVFRAIDRMQGVHVESH